MRFAALGPIVLGVVAFILTFLCLFAGSQKSFLPDYSILTVNASQIGENLLDSSYISSNSEISAILDLIPESIQSDAEALLNTVIHKLGIHDFYSANLMTYCEGYYTPTALPNATYPLSSITRNFTYCSPRSASFQFDPRTALQHDLNASGNSWLDASTQFDWPDEVDTGLKYVHIVQRVAFALYCAAIVLIALATVLSAISIFFSGRLSACGNVLLTALAALVLVIASVLATVIAVVGAMYINKYGADVGIAASAGHRFLGLTWAASAAVLISMVWWFVDCCVGRRGKAKTRKAERKSRRKDKALHNEKKHGSLDDATSSV